MDDVYRQHAALRPPDPPVEPVKGGAGPGLSELLAAVQHVGLQQRPQPRPARLDDCSPVLAEGVGHLIAVGIANLACVVPLAVLEPLLVRHVFRAGPVALGLMYSASGAGGTLASVAAARWPAPRRRIGTIWAAWSGTGLAASAGLALAVAGAGLRRAGLGRGHLRERALVPVMQRECPVTCWAGPRRWTGCCRWPWPAGLTGLAGVRLALIIGGSIAAATGSVLLVPGVTEPDRRAQNISLESEVSSS